MSIDKSWRGTLSSWRDARVASAIVFRSLAMRDADAVLSTKWRGLAKAEDGVAAAIDVALRDVLSVPFGSDVACDAATCSSAEEAAGVDAAAAAGILLAAAIKCVAEVETAEAEAAAAAEAEIAPAEKVDFFLSSSAETAGMNAAAAAATATAAGAADAVAVAVADAIAIAVADADANADADADTSPLPASLLSLSLKDEDNADSVSALSAAWCASSTGAESDDAKLLLISVSDKGSIPPFPDKGLIPPFSEATNNDTTYDSGCPIEWHFAMLWLEKRALSDGLTLRSFTASVASVGCGARAAVALALRHQMALVALARHELATEVFGDYSIHVAALGGGFFTPDDRTVNVGGGG